MNKSDKSSEKTLMQYLNSFLTSGLNSNPVSRHFDSLHDEQNYIKQHAFLFKSVAFVIALFGAVFLIFGTLILLKSSQLIYLPVLTMGLGSCLMSLGMRLQVGKSKTVVTRFALGKNIASMGWKVVIVSGILSMLSILFV